MHISTEINSFQKYGDNRAILRLLKEAGFTAYDFSMFYGSNAEKEILNCDDYIERATAFRAFADELGLLCNQAHAPFPTATDDNFPRFGMTTEDYNRFAHEKITRAIEIAGILGAKSIVVHPWNYYTVEENAALYRSFEATARKAGVKIAVENMWNWDVGAPTASAAACSHHEDFKAHLEVLPKDLYVACVDIGHAEMAGLDTDAATMIETLGERVQALHIHDNDRVHDDHKLPYTMKIDFSRMIESLKKIDYQGDVTLEADAYIKSFPLELYPQGAKFMAATADYIRKKLEKN